MTDAWKNWEGETVDGFLLRQYLGGSDHSAVYLTNLHSAGEPSAAIKFVRANGDADAQLERWRVAGPLNHPNLLSLYGVGRCLVGTTPLLYVVMEYAEENLSQILPQRVLEPEEARQMLGAVIEALTFLHSQGLAHTKLRPGNILAAGDQLKVSRDTLCEIGSAPVVRSELGIYDAPEFATAPISAAGDVWSVGATVVEALTQRTPVIRTETRVEVPVPETIPPPYLEIARRSVQYDPARRASLREISALLNPGVQPKRDPMLAPPNERVVPAEPLKKSLQQTEAALFDVAAVGKHKHAPLGSGLTQAPKQSRMGIYVVAAIVVIIAALAIPKVANRFAQLQPHADTVQPTIKPASELLDPPAAAAKRQQEIANAIAAKSAAPASLKPATPGAAPEAASPTAKSSKQSPNEAPAEAPTTAAREAGATVGRGAVLYQVVPDVSEQARQTILGTVKVNVRLKVDATGNVTNVALENDTNKFFAVQAVEVSNRWIFRPPQVDGHNAASEWVLRFEFTPTATKVFPTQVTP
jgi:serine/threonine protein kinase